MSVKVFQIGFSKCGTRSLHELFSGSGYKSVHWTIPNKSEKLASKIHLNYSNNKYILDGLEEFTFFTDMKRITRSEVIYSYTYYKEIYNQVKNAKFIFNTRPVHDWIMSVINWTDMFERYSDAYNTGIMGVIKRLNEHYTSHTKQVNKFFKDKPDRIITFDISKDRISKVIEFLSDFKLNKNIWGESHKTSNRTVKFTHRFRHLEKTIGY